MNEKLCRSCQYRGKDTTLGLHCTYILVTGKSRLRDTTPEQLQDGECACCKPKEKITKRVQVFIRRSSGSAEVRRLSTAVLSERIDARARQFYDLGLSDRRIAEGVGCSKKSIRDWRERNHLPSNYLQGGKKRERN